MANYDFAPLKPQRQFITSRFTQSDVDEAKRTRKWLDTGKPQPLQWIATAIPAAWYAIDVVAPENGISKVSENAKLDKEQDFFVATVTARKGHGKFARQCVGAAVSKHVDIALCFAYRNAIRQLLPQDINSIRWRDTKDNAARKYA